MRPASDGAGVRAAACHAPGPLSASQHPWRVAGRGGAGGEEGIVSIVWTIIVGFLVGVVAKLVHPGRENMGFVLTTLLGIAGSVLAGYIGQAVGLYQVGQGAGFIGSVIGALVILIVYGMIKGKAKQ